MKNSLRQSLSVVTFFSFSFQFACVSPPSRRHKGFLQEDLLFSLLYTRFSVKQYRMGRFSLTGSPEMLDDEDHDDNQLTPLAPWRADDVV